MVLLLGFALISYILSQPAGEWHLECVAWQDTGMCDLFCNCSDQTETCCITWQTGTDCKSCVWFLGAGVNQCDTNGRTLIWTAMMQSDCIDDWTIGSSGEVTASGKCACAGHTAWAPFSKPCDPSCQQASWGTQEACGVGQTERRLIPPKRPPTNGTVERFNGRIAEILKSARFQSGAALEQTLLLYARVYNHQIPQQALSHVSPVQALQNWQAKKPELFKKRAYQLAGRNS